MRSRRTGRHEEGALLLIVMVGAAVMMIGVAVAAQAWSSTWRRDSEEELIFRGNQYVDALLAYQKEHSGNLPVNLDDLMKPGPKRLRYIRKLFRDPINPSGKWGLLYLMPGGQAIYDPVAAQKAQTENPDAASAMSGVGTTRAGVTPISSFGSMAMGGMQTGAVVPPALMGGRMQGAAGQPGGGFTAARPAGMPLQGGGGMPGAAGQTAGMPGTAGVAFSGALPPPKPSAGSMDDDSPSEEPIGWPVVGVISRVTGPRNDKTFKTYKGHEKVNEWQFHIFDRGLPQTQAPQGAVPGGSPAPFIGPGFGNKGPLLGIGGTGPGPGGAFGRRNQNGTGGTQDPNRQNATGN